MKKLLACLLLAGSSCAYADWKLDNDKSSLNFISTKNQHISETHKFGTLSGTLSDQGKLNVTVSLSSVETGIGIRDQRMRDILFKVADIPSASLKAQIPGKLLSATVGSSSRKSIDATFIINGQSQTVNVPVQVTKLADNALLATSIEPVVLNAAQFKLDDGVAALQKLAGLAGISLAVPVTFSVTFIENKS